ncbi:SH3 domain-containing protein [Proteiniclasticum sp. C24MP]|uniref:SH3 domain-containing protein n=1 Tax=Proteiniclasticum sp. C24MP TaxID=3374101 RepID=UPI003754477C
MTKRIRVLILSAILFVIVFSGSSFNVSAATLPTISYESHVEKLGWTSPVQDGETSGTTESALRMEAMKLSVEGNDNLQLRYTAHVQSIGWQDYVTDHELAGTEGRKLRMEAIKIELTGSDAYKYDVYYRTHVEKFGWLDWAKNGHASGSAGYAYRVEAIEVKLVSKGASIGGLTDTPFMERTTEGNVVYTSHVERYGWLDAVSDGAMSGTEGEALRMEALKIRLSDSLPSGSVVYSSHVQSFGWMKEVRDNSLSGTTGLRKRVEAVKVRLEGEISNTYGIEYRTHIQGIGWSSWSRDGAVSGTVGQEKRLEAIEVRLYEKPVIIPEPDPEPQPEPGISYSIYKVDAASLNFRSAPSISSSIIGSIPRGEEVKVFSIDSNDWAYAEYNGKTGYLAAWYLAFVRDVVADPLPLVLEVSELKATYENEDVLVSGIVLSYSGVQDFSVMLDDKVIAVTRKDRPDLETQYKGYPDLSNMGFEANISRDVISHGSHKITISATGNDYTKIIKTHTFSMTKAPSVVKIDGFTDGQLIPDTDVKVTGIALSPQGVKAVNYYVNGVLKGQAEYGLTADAGTYPGYENITNGGYAFTLQKALLNKPVNTVKVEVVGHDNSTEYASVMLKGANSGSYTFEAYGKTLNDYVDLEYQNALKVGRSGLAVWLDLKKNMDSSNFIYHDTYKYMFLDLGYDPSMFTVTVEILDQMLAGKGILDGTGEIFLAAAIEHKVNPYYLVAHTLLETGNGTSVLANGQKVEVIYAKFGDINSEQTPVPEEDKDKLVYNMFGIGAYDSNANLWGAQRAYTLKWFSPEEAIAGGIKWIADNYIVKAGQNTLYKMRFNLSRNMVHQYATDPAWAYKQASTIKKQFDLMGVNEELKFVVPSFMK